jgi:hypothetical protein
MRIEGNTQGQAINLSELKGILEKVNVGDIVKAQILEIASGEALLKLFDGSTVKASTASNIEGKQGEILELVVKSKNDTQLILEKVKANFSKTATSDDDIKKQLIGIGLKADSKNIEIVKELKINNLTVNKEVLNKIVDLVTKFKDLTPSKAAFLLSGNIEPEEKNIAALNQLVDGKAKITVKLNDILKMVNDIEDTNVLKNIENHLKSLQPNITDKLKTAMNQVNSDKEPTITSNTGNSILNNDKAIKDMDNNKAIKQIVNNILNEGIKNFENKDSKNIIVSQNLTDKLSEFLKFNDINTKTIEKFMANLNKDSGLASKLSSKDQSILRNTIESIFYKIKDNISKAFDNFLVDVKSETLKEDINMKNMYKDIYSKLDAIKDSITNSNFPSKNEITNNIDNLQNNIRFMNELSSHNTYVQIPMQIWDKNTTSELYILKKNSKKKKIDPENVTVFISLNTQNLGQIDSLIGVNKKNISVNLRVEDQEIIDYLKENYKELYNRLHEKGYKLVDVKYRLIEEETNLLNIKDLVNRENFAGKSSIDYRL